MDDKITCGKCRFWDKILAEHGHCKKHTPQVNAEYEDEGVWPQTHENEWCFEAELPTKRSPFKGDLTDPYNHDPYGGKR